MGNGSQLGRCPIYAGGAGLYVINVYGVAHFKCLELGDHVNAVVCSPDGNSIAAGGCAEREPAHGFENSWRPQLLIVNAHSGRVTCRVYLGDPRSSIWDFGECARGPCCDMSLVSVCVTSVAYSPCARYIATGLSDGRLSIINVKTWAIIREVHFKDVCVNAVAYAPDTLCLTSSCESTWHIENPCHS